MAAGLSSGCHMNSVSSFPMALELCPLCLFRATLDPENDLQSLNLSVENMCFVCLVQGLAVVVFIS